MNSRTPALRLNRSPPPSSAALNLVKPALKKGAATIASWVPAEARTYVREGIVEPLKTRVKDRGEPLPLSPDRSAFPYRPSKGPLFVEGVSANDVFQGRASDCFFLASLAAVAKTHPKLIENAIQKNRDGSYTVSLHMPRRLEGVRQLGALGIQTQSALINGAAVIGLPLEDRVVKVTVRASVPMNGADAAAYAGERNESWPAIFEKAYAQLWNGYGAIGVGGDPGAALYALTGTRARFELVHRRNGGPAFSTMAERLRAGAPCVATSRPSARKPVIGAHVYTVVGISTEHGRQYVELRNPWGVNHLRLTPAQFARGFGTVTSL